MAKSSLELDLFSMDKDFNGLSPAAKPRLFQRKRSFRDMQGVITKMNPEVVKSVIEKGSLVPKKSSVSVPSAAPKETQTNFSQSSPLCDAKFSPRGGCENTAPMTIFYNGVVSVFDVSPSKAVHILKVAEEILPQSAESNSFNEKNLMESLNGDLPISRRNSLQRFLEKRKERLTMLSPCYFPPIANPASRKY